jgi:hypothetical protein
VENAGKISAMTVMGFPLSVLCSRRPMEMDKPHILASAAETGFL